MYKLNHERIVKLLGIILEDGNYALVMEYMTKGNLLHVLKQVKYHVINCLIYEGPFTLPNYHNLQTESS